ncbi:hypothetical protein K2173_018846 [Erythroxylum novogranatense]|uniref:HTH myb-type domain-containing protein n=1 Tax=Erythroxylum novogranatense TaxID=1862640 RepID=A0AAV8SBE3_9ROSI|nr:hypothetical protein K2173_018846 [Erythroxylum novogranatense]
MKSFLRRGVRQYRKSEVPRFRWTPELHQHFVDAIESLGGKYKATPKRILQMMSVNELNISHIKSHLQMYRNMKDHSRVDDLVCNRHLQTRKARTSICSSKRLLMEELKETRTERSASKSQISSEEGIQPLANKQCVGQEAENSGENFLPRISNEEEHDRELTQICQLSLSFIPSLSSIIEATEERDLLPLIANQGFPFNSIPNHQILDISEFNSFGSNHVNLDLTI